MPTPRFYKSLMTLVKSRSEPIFIWMWSTAVSCLIVGKGFPPLVPSLTAISAMIFLAMSVYVYNDVVDHELDKFNPVKKDRPLPSGAVPVDHAMKVVYGAAAIGLAIGLFTNIYSFALSLVYLLLFTIYSYPRIHLKKKVIAKEGIITSGVILTSLIGSYSVSGAFSVPAFFASVLVGVFAFTSQPAFNDTLDVETDKMQGVNSLAVVLTWKRRMQLLLSGLLVVMTLTPFTYTNMGFNILLPIFVVAGGLLLLRSMLPIMNSFEQIQLVKARKTARLFFLMLQIFTIVASFPLNLVP